VSEVQINNLQIVLSYYRDKCKIRFIPKKISDYVYELNLGKILYSRYVDFYLEFDSDMIGLIHVIGESKNIAMLRSGMIGYYYCE
jgi:hypothetical protein